MQKWRDTTKPNTDNAHWKSDNYAQEISAFRLGLPADILRMVKSTLVPNMGTDSTADDSADNYSGNPWVWQRCILRHYAGQDTVLAERMTFMDTCKQRHQETIDDFEARCKHHGSRCDHKSMKIQRTNSFVIASSRESATTSSVLSFCHIKETMAQSTLWPTSLTGPRDEKLQPRFMLASWRRTTRRSKYSTPPNLPPPDVVELVANVATVVHLTNTVANSAQQANLEWCAPTAPAETTLRRSAAALKTTSKVSGTSPGGRTNPSRLMSYPTRSLTTRITTNTL